MTRLRRLSAFGTAVFSLCVLGATVGVAAATENGSPGVGSFAAPAGRGDSVSVTESPSETPTDDPTDDPTDEPEPSTPPEPEPTNSSGAPEPSPDETEESEPTNRPTDEQRSADPERTQRDGTGDDDQGRESADRDETSTAAPVGADGSGSDDAAQGPSGAAGSPGMIDLVSSPAAWGGSMLAGGLALLFVVLWRQRRPAIAGASGQGDGHDQGYGNGYDAEYADTYEQGVYSSAPSSALVSGLGSSAPAPPMFESPRFEPPAGGSGMAAPPEPYSERYPEPYSAQYQDAVVDPYAHPPAFGAADDVRRAAEESQRGSLSGPPMSATPPEGAWPAEPVPGEAVPGEQAQDGPGSAAVPAVEPEPFEQAPVEPEPAAGQLPPFARPKPFGTPPPFVPPSLTEQPPVPPQPPEWTGPDTGPDSGFDDADPFDLARIEGEEPDDPNRTWRFEPAAEPAPTPPMPEPESWTPATQQSARTDEAPATERAVESPAFTRPPERPESFDPSPTQAVETPDGPDASPASRRPQGQAGPEDRLANLLSAANELAKRENDSHGDQQ